MKENIFMMLKKALKAFSLILAVVLLVLVAACKDKAPNLDLNDSMSKEVVELKFKDYISYNLREKYGKASYQPVSWYFNVLYNAGTSHEVLSTNGLSDYDKLKSSKIFITHKFTLKTEYEQKDEWIYYEYDTNTKAFKEFEKNPMVDENDVPQVNNNGTEDFQQPNDGEAAPITSDYKY